MELAQLNTVPAERLKDTSQAITNNAVNGKPMRFEPCDTFYLVVP